MAEHETSIAPVGNDLLIRPGCRPSSAGDARITKRASSQIRAVSNDTAVPEACAATKAAASIHQKMQFSTSNSASSLTLPPAMSVRVERPTVRISRRRASVALACSRLCGQHMTSFTKPEIRKRVTPYSG